MKQLTTISMEENDLRIVEFLNPESLPMPLQQMLTLAATDEERDMLLMATLTAAGSCLPNLYFRYGPTGKKYYANLQTFILAASASGKGIANQALEMMRVVDEVHPMLIPGDSTLPAWFKALQERGGCGYMHESEGSVITDIWRASAANYNTALRKAAEHEPISRNRCTGASEIKCPRLSMLLTGTFNQYRALVPSVENGYFSRLLTMVVRGSHPFDRQYVSASMTQSAIPMVVGNQLLRLYEQLAAGEEREWSLTEAQKERLGIHLETEYATLIDLLGDNFHSVIIRMAIQIERVAMILSAFRLKEELSPLTSNLSPLYCLDADYETAELIGNKLLLHIAAAYQMIEGDKSDLVPDIQPLDQRKILLSALPEEYESKTLVAEAQTRGIARRTALRWNEKWQQEGIVQQVKYGTYKKVG